ncbi:extracellular solute-binding protein [Paenibacillus sp. PL2-23]|uniref:ABC transporter substrate-binding protein n=1 Tax=Paenibacillus sp. PL2-23 TaxID=2100729 RepID=UPI0030F6807E
MANKVYRLCLLALILCLLAGCDSSGKDWLGDTVPGEDPVVRLTFWGGVPAEAGPQEVVDRWNAINPGIQVEYVRYVNDNSGNMKLDTALMTGQSIDLFASYTIPRLESRVLAGTALALNQFDDYDIDEMMGPEAEEWQIDGRYYAIPTKKNRHFFWLNKDLLDQAGLPVPVDWTWEDVRYYARILQDHADWGMVQTLREFHYPMDGSMSLLGYVKPDGKSNLDHAYIRSYLQSMYEMMHEDRTTPQYGDQIANKMPVEPIFLSGQAGLFFGGEWIFRFANNTEQYPRSFKIAFAPEPRIEEEQTGYSALGGLGDAISIHARSPHPKEAWAFLKWYADEGMLPTISGGRIPASRAFDRDQALKLLLGDREHLYDVPSLLRVLGDDYPTYQLKVDQQVIDIRREEYEKYLMGLQSLDETMERMAMRHNQLLSET